MGNARYTSNGTIFYKPDDNSWAVQLEYYLGGGGAPFKVIKWATWENDNYILKLQETNEPPDMYGWRIATEEDLILYCTPQIEQRLEYCKSLVDCYYKGHHNTNPKLMSELEWKFNGHTDT